MSPMIFPILIEGLDCIVNCDQEISSSFGGGLPHIFDCVPLLTEHQGTTVVVSDFFHDQTEIRSIVVIVPHPIKEF